MTGCKQRSHDEIMKCLREQSPESILRAAPYKKWLNSHLHDLPDKNEISSILAIVDGKVMMIKLLGLARIVTDISETKQYSV